MRISTGCLVLCVVGGISCKTQKDLDPCGEDPLPDCDNANEDHNFYRSMSTDLIHGTMQAGVVSATSGNGLLTVGISQRVRIVSVRYNSTDDPSIKAAEISTFLQAMDYLVDAGAAIVVVEASDLVDYSGDLDPGIYEEKVAIEFESHPEVLFVVPAGNKSSDCDNPNIGCFYAESGAANALSVAQAMVVDGLLQNPIPTADPTKPDEHFNTSNYGENTISMSAPGNGIATVSHLLNSKAGTSDFPLYYYYRDDVCTRSWATSAAGAVVGGVAALSNHFCTLNGAPWASGEDGANMLLSLAADGLSDFGYELEVIDHNFLQAAPLNTSLCP